MENFVFILISALLATLLIRLMLLPVKLTWKLTLNGACGFLCLWLVDLTSGLTGLSVPINAVTAIIAGTLGLPGLLLLVMLQFLL